MIIAEAGVNHNGSIDLAKQLIDAASDAGADYVKFQTFIAHQLVTQSAKRAAYQKTNTTDEGGDDSQLQMLKKLELSDEQHHELVAYCKQKSIEFLSTAFDLRSLEFIHSLKLGLIKVPSGEITNLPYLKKVGAMNKKVVLSTGMSVMNEVEEAISVLVGAGTARENISVLHCTTDYPTSMKDVNLNAMLTLKEHFQLPVGYSDHTNGIEVAVAAVAMGATIIEKHFTIDKTLPGPDHKASLEPDELKAMVSAIRNIEDALGVADKKPTESEKKNSLVARKSIHLAHDLIKGHVLVESDLIMKRPGDGISPMRMEDVVGKTILNDLSVDYKLEWEDLE